MNKNLTKIFSCVIGSVLLISVFLTLFYNVVEVGGFSGLYANIDNTFKDITIASLVESLSWASIYAVLGVALLSCECLIIKGNSSVQQYATIGLTISLLCLFVVTIIFYNVNSSLFYNGAIIFSMTLVTSSLVGTFALYSQEVFLKVIVIVLLLVGITILMVQRSDNYMPEQISQVAKKYENEVISLGYFEADYYYRDGLAGIHEGSNYSLKNGSDKFATLVSRDELCTLIKSLDDDCDEIDNRFKKLSIFVERGKLYIKGLNYNAESISQQQLTEQLNLVMEKIAMPRLRNIKNILDKRNANEKSYR